VLESECIFWYNQAVEKYNEGLKENFQHQETEKPIRELFELLKDLRDATLGTFNNVIYVRERNSDLYTQYFDQLQGYCNDKEDLVFKLNDDLSETRCKDLCDGLFMEVENKINNNEYQSSNPKPLLADLRKAMVAYEERAAGPLKGDVLINAILNLNEKMLPSVFNNARMSLDRHDQERMVEVEKYEALERDYTRKIEDLKSQVNRSEREVLFLKIPGFKVFGQKEKRNGRRKETNRKTMGGNPLKKISIFCQK
jgi:Guanylate-binding protein, C-terminal domain